MDASVPKGKPFDSELKEIEELGLALAKAARAAKNRGLVESKGALPDGLSAYSQGLVVDLAFGHVERSFLEIEAAMLRAKAKIWARASLKPQG